MKSATRGNMEVIFAAVGFGMMGVTAKLAYNEGANPSFLQAMRFSMAAIPLWIYELTVKGKEAARVNRTQLVTLFTIGGIVCFSTGMLYFYSIMYIPISLSTVIFYLYPVITNVFAIILFKEKIAAKQVVALGSALIGIGIMVWAPAANINWFGVLLSFLAAVINGFYVLMLDFKSIRNLDPIMKATYIITFRSVSFLIAGFLSNQMGVKVSPECWGIILFMAIFVTVLPNIQLYRGIKRIGPSRASIIHTFEPVVAALLGILIFDEVLSSIQVVGAILIISALFLISMAKYDVVHLSETRIES